MDSRKCQTSTATPAEPGGLPALLEIAAGLGSLAVPRMPSSRDAASSMKIIRFGVSPSSTPKLQITSPGIRSGIRLSQNPTLSDGLSFVFQLLASNCSPRHQLAKDAECSWRKLRFTAPLTNDRL